MSEIERIRERTERVGHHYTFGHDMNEVETFKDIGQLSRDVLRLVERAQRMEEALDYLLNSFQPHPDLGVLAGGTAKLPHKKLNEIRALLEDSTEAREDIASS